MRLINALAQLIVLGFFCYEGFKFESTHNYYHAAWAAIFMLEAIYLDLGRSHD